MIDLRAARLNRGKSLDDVADETGVPKGIIARAERRESEPRRPKDKLAIASYFGFQVTDIWPVPDAEEVKAA